MAKKIQPNELLSELAHFTGTTQWFKNPMFPNFRYTDGVKYLAEKASGLNMVTVNLRISSNI